MRHPRFRGSPTKSVGTQTALKPGLLSVILLRLKPLPIKHIERPLSRDADMISKPSSTSCTATAAPQSAHNLRSAAPQLISCHSQSASAADSAAAT